MSAATALRRSSSYSGAAPIRASGLSLPKARLYSRRTRAARFRVVAAAILALWNCAASAELARNTAAEDEKVTEGLLEKPAPARDWRAFLRQRGPIVREKPAADAAADAVLSYWRSAEDNETPDDATRARLLKICVASSAEIPALLRFLPLDSPAVQQQLKSIHDRLAGERGEKVTRTAELLRNALMHHSGHFRDELIRRAFWPDDVTEHSATEAMTSFIRLDRAGP